MKQNNISLERLSEAIGVLENPDRDPQKLSEILPFVLTVLKCVYVDIEQAYENKKFYGPAWVNELLKRLSTDKQPLDDTEYCLFKSLAIDLSVNDYKPAQSGLVGYHLQYTTPQEISETVIALKHYFKLL